MLHFSAPLLLFALPAALLPLLLYWWKRRQRRRRRFPSLQLIRQTAAEQARRLRIREILLLLLRILALTCLVLAATGPIIRSEGLLADLPGRVVVLLDRSLSMTAEDGGGERFERAKGACARYLKLLPGGTRVDVIAFDDHPRLVAESVGPLEALSALGGIEAGLGGTDLAAALDFVASRLDRLEESVVVALFSDLPAGGFSEPINFEYPLLVYPAGLRAENGGIIELAALNPLPLAGVKLEMAVEVTGPPRDYRLYVGGEEIALRESVTGRFRVGVVPVEPGWDVYRLAAEPTDPFGVDDVRRLAVYVHPAPRVYTLGEVGLMETVLETAPGLVEMTEVIGEADVILWSAQGPLTADGESLLETRLRAGAGLVIAVPPVAPPSFPPWMGIGPTAHRVSSVGYRLGPVVENPITFPLIGPLSELTRTVIAYAIAAPLLGEDWRVLLRYSGGEPALAVRKVYGGTILLWLLPFRSDDGPFAATEVFSPLLLQTIRFCAYGEGEPSTYTAGETPAIPASSGGRLVAPDGEETVFYGEEPLQVELDQIGVWMLHGGDRVPAGIETRGSNRAARQGYLSWRPFTVNAPVGEGDLEVLDVEEFGLFGPSVELLTDDALTGDELGGPFPLWRVLLVLSIIALLVELALADSTWR